MSVQRYTIQLSLVFEAVNQLKCHATADEIYEQIAKQHPTVSKATVYRNLNKLTQMGKIKKIEIPNSADRFDHITSNHYHCLCEKCGKLFDTNMEYITDLQDKIKDVNGFEITGHDIIFRGICQNCKNNIK